MKHSSLSASFCFALLGIKQVIKRERNFKIHLLAAILAIAAGVYFGISKTEWLVLILTISLVLSAEIFNSAIEDICNLLNRKLNLGFSETTDIRNFSAGAVLVLAISALFLGFLIFSPALFK